MAGELLSIRVSELLSIRIGELLSIRIGELLSIRVSELLSIRNGERLSCPLVYGENEITEENGLKCRDCRTLETIFFKQKGSLFHLRTDAQNSGSAGRLRGWCGHI